MATKSLAPIRTEVTIADFERVIVKLRAKESTMKPTEFRRAVKQAARHMSNINEKQQRLGRAGFHCYSSISATL